jgi:hypothetical protein
MMVKMTMNNDNDVVVFLIFYIPEEQWLLVYGKKNYTLPRTFASPNESIVALALPIEIQ